METISQWISSHQTKIEVQTNRIHVFQKWIWNNHYKKENLDQVEIYASIINDTTVIRQLIIYNNKNTQARYPKTLKYILLKLKIILIIEESRW